MPTNVLMPFPDETKEQDLPAPKSVSLPEQPVVSNVLTGPVEHYAMDDTGALRKSIFDKVHLAVQNRFPVENSRYRIEVSKLRYGDAKVYSKREQKDALLKQSTLSRKLKGRWRLIDRETNQVIDEQDKVIVNVPYLTERGTFIKGGNEYGVANQSRLKPGAYNRRRANQELETHFNILKGGRSFHLVMDPATKNFTIRVGGAKLQLAPVLKAMGYNDRDLKANWGDEIYNANIKEDDSPKRARAQFGRFSEEGESLADIFRKMEMDPEVTEQTLKQPYTNVEPVALMSATQRLIAIARGDEEENDRDSIAFQQIMGPDDLFAERIAKDYDKLVQQRLLWNSTNKGRITAGSGFLNKQLDTVFTRSGLAQALEETNPVENLDHMYKVLRTGEAGISSEGVPIESRDVQGTHIGIIDPVRSPESGKTGLDSRFTINVRRGSDGQVYTMLRDQKGETVPVAAKDAAHSTIAFPGEGEKPGKRVRAMVGGKIKFVDRNAVDYWVNDSSHMFSTGSNLVPMISSTLGPRLLMGGKFYNQALPMKDAEAPLVQSLSDDGESSFEELYGTKAGAVRSDVRGKVIKITDDEIQVKTAKGIVKKDLYHNFPFNRLAFLHNTPQVTVGDHVNVGDLLASSNTTDKSGTLALGKNLRTAYMPWKGMNTDDAIVISESAAQKLQSEHMFTKKIDNETHVQRDRKGYVAMYPSKYRKEQLANIGEDGVIRPGMFVQKGDPLILAVKARPITDIHRGHKPGWIDSSEEWDREAEGFITDVEKTKKGVRISIKAYQPMQVGDKLVGRMGDKGVIANIEPDGEMPHYKDGTPIDAILNPLTTINRVNPSQLVELALGKVAEATGKPIKIPGFIKGSMIQHAIDKLKEAGISDVDTLSDPSSKRRFKDILTGNRFFMKLHHMAEDKEDARGYGGYTAEEQPVRGGHGSAKQLGNMGINALLSHGALAVLRDAKTIRAQKNTDFWKAFQMGYAPPSPDVPMVYNKFKAHLIGAGINVNKVGHQENLMALTDKDVLELSSGEIKLPKGVDIDTMKELEGGLFDKRLTGGHGGARWSHVKLDEPIPNPVMEEPIRRLLGLTQKQYEDVLSGKQTMLERTGGAAILESLKRINVPQLKRQQEEIIRDGKKTKRDNAIKLLNYIRGMERSGLRPENFVMHNVPVLPPMFRPISSTEKFTIVSDANRLYVDLIKSNEALREVKSELGSDQAGDERLNLYNSFKAITGLADPISPQLRQQRVKGLLGHVFGNTPKWGMFQRRVLGGAVDFSGRGVISPNPSLDMDHVGLPEDQAWELYKPMIMRRMTQRGMAPTVAAKNILERNEVARTALVEEMESRPILINRAPTLHKYNTMAVFPRLVKGHTLQVSPIIATGFNADYDGDAMQIHVPVSKDAVAEAKEKMLPSKNLLAAKDFKAHYVPSQEFQHGLWAASVKQSKREYTTFGSVEAAIAAYRNGEIDADDKVKIITLHKKKGD